MIVYSHSLTPRLQYVIDFLSDYYGTTIKLTSNEGKYTAAPDACKLNYSFHKIVEGELWVHPHPLLSESAVRPVKAVVFDYKGYKAFFKTEGNLPFDIFAALFFLLTRYEEYLPHQKDAYGRYAHENSLAFKSDFLKTPLINIWLEDLRQNIAAKEEAFRSKKGFQFIPTYDIDIAWSFKNKGFKRNAGALLQHFFKGRWRSMAHRIKVLRNRGQDPFDCYGWLQQLHAAHNLKPLYFFLVAEKRNRYDRNIAISNTDFQALVKEVAATANVGLHPSWQSSDVHALLKKEKIFLEGLAENKIKASRQHYIRLTLPQTYRRLIEAGITNDYSMGYGSINGFRASVATPFYWYDLNKEEKTSLRVHPFAFMDANSYHEQKLTPEDAAEELAYYHKTVSAVGGTLYTIWHNNFLGTDAQFEGWRQLYERFVQTIQK